MYYKVVSKFSFDGTLYSAVIDDDCCIKYKKNVKTFPIEGTGGIFVFKDIEYAIKFKNENHQFRPLEIWECQVTNPRQFKVRGITVDSYIKSFWNLYFTCKKKHMKISDIGHTAPEGTYLASSVTLIKKVEL